MRKLGIVVALAAVAASIVGTCVLINCKKNRNNAIVDTDLDQSVAD